MCFKIVGGVLKGLFAENRNKARRSVVPSPDFSNALKMPVSQEIAGSH